MERPVRGDRRRVARRSYRIRGPFYSFEEPPKIMFDEARFAPDVAVSGTVVWHRRSAVAVGRLWVEGPGTSGRLRIVFDTDRSGDTTSISGTMGGRSIELETSRAWTS